MPQTLEYFTMATESMHMHVNCEIYKVAWKSWSTVMYSKKVRVQSGWRFALDSICPTPTAWTLTIIYNKLVIVL